MSAGALVAGNGSIAPHALLAPAGAYDILEAMLGSEPSRSGAPVGMQRCEAGVHSRWSVLCVVRPRQVTHRCCWLSRLPARGTGVTQPRDSSHEQRRCPCVTHAADCFRYLA
jgi:hypothetical protein